MSEVNFKSIQILHESLLQKQQKVSEENQQDFTKEVREYIEQAKKGGSNISSTRERDQIRANLRYWANYVYSIDKNFPDTELAPSAVKEKRFSVNLIGAIVAFFVIFLITALAIGSMSNNSNETPTNTPTFINAISVTQTQSAMTQAVEASAIPAAASPTSVFKGSDVVFAIPENGENVPPKIVFEGAYTNLSVGSTIHVLLIKNDKLYPFEDAFPVSQESTTGNWEIDAVLYQNLDELKQAETLVVVPAACFDNLCRDKLANAVKTGIAADELPSQLSLKLYKESSRVVYRNAYQPITEVRLVYSIFYEAESSFDLYTSKPDGSEIKRIKLTPDISELFPNLSPDGTKIVYVKRFRNAATDPFTYAISIMDSNGENDYEITERTKNVLESPQWAPDSSYISYAIGDLSLAPGKTYWSIHTLERPVKKDEIWEDKIVTGESERLLSTNRYHSWVPDSNSIVYNTRKNKTATSGFVQISITSPENQSLFFDTKQEEIQPYIEILGDGYLLTYTVINPDNTHDIYAVLNSSQQIPLNDDSKIRLTYRGAGEVINGSKIGNADYPISDPDSNSIYYLRNVNIYKLIFTIDEGKIVLKYGPKNDGERYGDLVIETGLNDEILGFDVSFMEAYFPIQ